MFEVPCQCIWPQKEILKEYLLSGASVRFPKATFNWKCWYNCNWRQNAGGIGTLASDRPLELELSFHHLKAWAITRQGRERLFSFLLQFQWKFWALYQHTVRFPDSAVEVAASVSASRLHPAAASGNTTKATVVPLGACSGQRCGPARHAAVFPNKYILKGKETVPPDFCIPGSH